MTIPVDVLRELHHLHRQLSDLQSQTIRGPKQIQAGEQAIQHGEQELAAAKEAWKQARKESADQHLQLKEREAKIADLQRKLNECKTNVEFKTLRDQVAAEKQANGVLEDEMLDKLEKIDQLHQQVADVEHRLGKTREELAKIRLRVGGEQQTVQAETARLTELLARAEARLPHQVREDYDRIVKARGEAAMAPVDGECCGGCYTLLTPQTMNLLHLSRLAYCKSCGCLLYLSEAAASPETQEPE